MNDTQLLPHLLRLGRAVCAAINRLLADAGDDSDANRAFCLKHGVVPVIRSRTDTHGSGLGKVRHIVENALAWLLANNRLDRRRDRSTLVVQSLLTAACLVVIASRMKQL